MMDPFDRLVGARAEILPPLQNGLRLLRSFGCVPLNDEESELKMKVTKPDPVAPIERTPTDLITIRDLANRYGKSDRHIRRIIALPGFPKPFRVGAIGRRLHWHFEDIIEWERRQKQAATS